MKLRIHHETCYQYSPTVATAQHVAHLEPATTPCQSCAQHSLITSPEATNTSRNIDAFGNYRLYWSLTSPHDTLTVSAVSDIETFSIETGRLLELNKSIQRLTWENAKTAYQYRAGQASDEWSGLAYGSHHAPIDLAFRLYAQTSFPAGRNLVESARHLMQRIHHEFKYESLSTDVSTPALSVLNDKRGVCQDFAHVMLSCLRSLGLAARYVSGYLLTEPPPGQARLIGSDASHAWASVYIPSLDLYNKLSPGIWCDFDPTNNRWGFESPGEDYIFLAQGRDYADVSPIRGVIKGGANHDLKVEVTVRPINTN
jgi:transglutaminase-like putative cysteine protease